MGRFVDCDINKTIEFLCNLSTTLDADTCSLYSSLRNIIYKRSPFTVQTDGLFVYCLTEAVLHEKLSDKKIMRIIKNYLDNVNDKGYERLYKYIPQELF